MHDHAATEIPDDRLLNPAFFSGLYRAGYEGPVVIEHEDRGFEGSEEMVKRGFLLARDVLRPYVK